MTADVTRRNKAGEFYTPRGVVRMKVEILARTVGESIYDPRGSGRMLHWLVAHLRPKNKESRTPKLFGLHACFPYPGHLGRIFRCKRLW